MASLATWVLTVTLTTVGIVAANWHDIQRIIAQRRHNSTRARDYQPENR